MKDKVAFDQVHRGYRFVATYLAEPKGEALIQISKCEQVVRETLWPAYKIWNIAAHADDIVNGLEENSSEGFFVAGDVGFGANVYCEAVTSGDK